MTYSALAVVAAGLCLCAQLTLAYSRSSGSDDSIINRYISQDTGESVRSESQIPIEVDQITLVTPSMDNPNFKIVNKHRGGETHLQIGANGYNNGEDDYMLEYPQGMRLMASYYDDDLLGGSAYRIPGLSNIFNDTGVFKKMTIESIDSTTNQVNFSATVETVQLVFGITSKNAKSYSKDRDMISQTEIGQDRCNYMDRENCEYTNIASYIQTCDIRTNASCVLFLNTTAPAPGDVSADDMRCMFFDTQRNSWQENTIIPLPPYTAQPTPSDCRDECLIWNAQQGLDVPYICAFVNTTAYPYFCFVFEKPAGETWDTSYSCGPTSNTDARTHMFTTLNDDADPNTRRRRSLLEVSPPHAQESGVDMAESGSSSSNIGEWVPKGNSSGRQRRYAGEDIRCCTPFMNTEGNFVDNGDPQLGTGMSDLGSYEGIKDNDCRDFIFKITQTDTSQGTTTHQVYVRYPSETASGGEMIGIPGYVEGGGPWIINGVHGPGYSNPWIDGDSFNQNPSEPFQVNNWLCCKPPDSSCSEYRWKVLEVLADVKTIGGTVANPCNHRYKVQKYDKYGVNAYETSRVFEYDYQECAIEHPCLNPPPPKAWNWSPTTEAHCLAQVGFYAKTGTAANMHPTVTNCAKITNSQFYNFDPSASDNWCQYELEYQGIQWFFHSELSYTDCPQNCLTAPPTVSPTQFPTLSPTRVPSGAPTPDQDFACPVDINIPLRNRYFDRRNDCELINGIVETQEKPTAKETGKYVGTWDQNLDKNGHIQNGWIKAAADENSGLSEEDQRTEGMKLIVKEACESAIGCRYDDRVGACRAISEGEGGPWDITKQTGKFWVSALVEVTIPADWTKGSGECKYRTFWNDGRLNKDYFDDIKTLGYSGGNDQARGKMRLFFEDSFFSTTINVNPYPPFNPSPPPTPPMTNRYDLYFDYNGTGYTILGTRGAPDVSLKRYDAPIFPAGEESWVAVAGVPVATSRVDKSEVVYESINVTDPSQGKNDTKSLEIIKGSEGNPEYTKDLRLVLLTDLGPEGAYELNKPLGVYQSIQFSDTFDGGSACRAPNKIFVNTTNTTNTTAFFYAQNTERYVAQPNQTCGNYNMTQTYCYSAIILNVVTGKASDRYYFNFTCPPMTAEPTMFPTFADSGESIVPTTVPTTLAAGAEGFTESEIKKAERSIIEVVLVFCGCLAALLIAVVMVNTLMGSKRNTVDLRNLPPKDKEKVCGPPPPRYGATTVSIEAKPHQNDGVFVGNSKTLKWV